jgi:carbonic anhydrase
MSIGESILKRRSFLVGSALVLAGGSAAAWKGLAPRGQPLPPGMDAAELAEMRLPSPRDPDEALERLVNGNQLFVSENYEIGDTRRGPRHRLTLAGSQNPFALVLGCADSRVSPELLFNAGLGDLFVVRVIGNLVDPRCFSVIGSIEYAVHELKIPLVMVLGHEQCGAVKAAIRVLQEKIELPDAIDAVADSIRPVVEGVSEQAGDLVANAVAANVRHGVTLLKTSTPLLAEPLAAGHLKVVGAAYDLKTGCVKLLT